MEAWRFHLSKQVLLFHDGISTSHIPTPGRWILPQEESRCNCHTSYFLIQSILLFSFFKIQISLRFIGKDHHYLFWWHGMLPFIRWFIYSTDIYLVPSTFLCAKDVLPNKPVSSLTELTFWWGIQKMNKNRISGSDKCYHKITISQFLFPVEIFS